MTAMIPAHLRILATHLRPSYTFRLTLVRQRVQGRPGADRTHGPRATKSTRQNHRWQPNVRPSLRDGLRLTSRSPRGPAFLPPSSPARQNTATWHQHRDARTTRLDRPRRRRSSVGPSRPPHPASRSWRSRSAPPIEAGRAERSSWFARRRKVAGCDMVTRRAVTEEVTVVCHTSAARRWPCKRGQFW